MAHIPYYEAPRAQTWGDVLMDIRNPNSTDVLDQADTFSLELLREGEPDAQELAGIDDLTPVDTFINLNGDKAYVTR
jgi:hypothetical protein